MALAPGTRLGPYEITAHLGAGGMGEVWCATDSNLGRQVAIKVLPDAFASDAERLARFEREARTLAALNHPNIAAVYGLEKVDGTRALVMELVEGPTLADRLAQGPLPVDEALPIAKQIAEALETAHEKGIVHRDLKPANVKLRPDGTVKVLDFGLAKALEQSGGSGGAGRPDGLQGPPDLPDRPDLSASPTLTSPALLTGVGVVLGTAAYMSPEQARGKAVDQRADIWAFGCVLYEMLAGRRAFEGEEVSDTLANVLKSELDWTQLPRSTPTAVRTLLRRCLEKDPRRRRQSAADVRIEIEEAVNAPADRAETIDQRLTLTWRWMLVAALAVILAAAAAGITAWSIRRTEQPPALMRMRVGVAPADRLATSMSVRGPDRPLRTAIVLSPDGQSLVFVGDQGGNRRLYVRRMDTLDATVILGTENADSPFFSPDGQWVGFWQGSYNSGASGELKKVPLSGGPAVRLCDTPRPWGVSWGSHGRIVFANAFGSGLWHVADTGGIPQQLTTVDATHGEAAHRLPQVLPGGEFVLFTVHKALRRLDDAQIVVQSLASGARKTLVERATDARYVPTGHLLYVQSGTLMAVPFDRSRLAVIGRPIALLDEVMQDVISIFVDGRSGATQLSVSASGTLAYVPGGISTSLTGDHVWVNRRGMVEKIQAGLPDLVPGGRLSPDGSRITLTADDLSVYDIARGVLTRVTKDAFNGIWHPDGERIAFASGTSGPRNLFWIAADGSRPAERLTTSDRNQYPSSWSPDGRTLAFVQSADGADLDVWVLSVGDGPPVAKPFLATPSREEYPEFSPDGRWLAYGSNESGRPEVWVQAYPGPGPRVMVSVNGGTQPAWAQNGRELFYTEREPDGRVKMMAVPMTLGEAVTPGRPQMLFEGDYLTGVVNRAYDITHDAGRFLMQQIKEESAAPPITQIVLVQNWQEELKRLVPTR